MTFKNDWFDGCDSRRQLPAECVADCSGAGDATANVEFWLERLSFDGPAWLFREHLREYGAWSDAQLCDHQQNRARVLWIWANDCSENPGAYDYLHLGV